MRRKPLPSTAHYGPMAPSHRAVGSARRWRPLPLLLLAAFAFMLLELCIVQLLPSSPGFVVTPSDSDALALRVPDLHSRIGQSAGIPGWLFTDGDQDVPLEEREHLSWLHAACVLRKQGILPWQHGAPHLDKRHEDEALVLERGDPRVVEQLRHCADVDIYLPDKLRDVDSYCEDAVAYIKFLHARALPPWVLEERFYDPRLKQELSYHELCPLTPMLFLDHHWDSRTDEDWPRDKPVYVMPNIRTGELTPQQLWRADVVLCRTLECDRRVKRWYEQEGNPRDAKVFYTKHASSDAASHALEMLGEENVRPKDFANVRFTHTAGSSALRGTRQVLECWLSRPELPSLDLYMDGEVYDHQLRKDYHKRIADRANINLVRRSLTTVAFGKVMAETAFFLCPSAEDDYGHYLNQARASGGVIVTTDAHPLDELITATSTGVVITTERKVHPNMLLGGGYKGDHGLESVDGLVSSLSSKELCRAVDSVIQDTSPAERAAMAANTRKQYHQDTKFFAQRMLQLQHFARETREAWVPEEGDVAVGDPERPVR